MILELSARGRKITAYAMLSVLYLGTVLPPEAMGAVAPVYHAGHTVAPVTRTPVGAGTAFPVNANAAGEISPVPSSSKKNKNVSAATQPFNGGPGQPESSAFHSVGSSNMVDLFTGDFSYSIPLIDVGGYPVAIGYNSGISMDQEESWVGLGWNVNPGAINRNMRGVPDDFRGVDTIHKTMSVKDNKTIGVTVGGDMEITGFPIPVKPSAGASMGIFHNTYKGWGMEQSFNAGVNGGSKSMGTFSGSLSLTSNSQEGLTVNTSMSYKMSDEEVKQKGGFSGTFGIGTSFNSRAGLRALQLSGGLRHYTVDEKNNTIKKYWGENYGSSISFANPTFTPAMSMRFTNTSFSFTGKVGWETKVVHPSIFMSGYVSKQGVAEADKHLSLPAYGYLNYQHANGNPGALLDYNREKDIPYREKPAVPNIAVPYYTYDVFSMTGEGTGGMFRAYRGDIGFVHDHYMRSKDLSLSGSVDIGVGDIAHAGGDIHLNRAVTETGPWVEQNPLARNFRFMGSRRYFEAAFFKNVGELTVNHPDFYNTIGGDDLVAAELYQPGNNGPVITTTNTLNRYRNQQLTGKLPVTAANSYKKGRDPRSQAISYLTAEEASVAGISRYIENYKPNEYTSAGCNTGFPDEVDGKGVGLKGEYFAGRNFDRKLFERVDATINFTHKDAFNYHLPDGAPAVWDDFSVRWTGRLKVDLSGPYKITTTSDDGVRLYINDSLVIDHWYNHPPTDHSTTVNLVAGQVLNLKLEYFEGRERCVMGLFWQYSGGLKTPIPARNLYLMPVKDTFNVDSVLTREQRVNNFRKPHHISEIRVLNENGKRYVYGLPVYSLGQKDVSFSVDAADGNREEGLASYIKGVDNSTGNKKGKDNFFSSEEMPAYAHSYLLTGILSPDYSDLTGDGITDDDLGMAVKFNYSKVAGIRNPHAWRTPNGLKASYNEGLRTDTRDDRGSYVSGKKELWYLHSIESANMIAIFKTSGRADAFAIDEDGVKKGAALRQLDEINLYVKADFQRNGELARPVKTVHFEYDHELCPGVNAPLNQTGKLTLKRIWFSYNGNNKGIKNPYIFKYNQHNPAYDGRAYDRWGNYKVAANNPGSVSGDVVTNAEYPYAVQDSAVAAYNAAAWTLDSIILPSGGRMKITYESDDYGFVQNKKAMQMFSIAGFSNNKPEDNDDLDNKLYGLTDNLYVAIHVPRPVSSDREVYTRYLDGSEKLFFRLSVKMPSDKFGSGNEYVPVYATLEPGSYGYFNNGNTIWLKVKPIDGKGKTGNLLSVNSPLAMASIQFLRQNLPSKAYPGSDVGDDIDLESAVKVLVSQADNVLTSVAKYDHIARMRGWAKQVELKRSTVRLNNPWYKKYGGGVRVKNIRIYDHWNAMTQQKESVYGQEYQYTTTRMIDGVAEEISSGVASYEPILGGEENPFRQPIEYIEQVAPLAPVNMGYTEMPIGEALFPAPSVGYSKVRVRSIHTKNKRSANGLEESCFYTAYDFPTLTEMTALADGKKRFKPALANFLRINARHFVAVSQGFKVELNNMHGKMKSQASYSETDMKTPLAYTEYFYRVEDQQAEFKKLRNDIPVMDATTQITDRELGKDIELMADFRQQRSVTNVNNLNINGDLFTFSLPPVFLIPMLLQLAQREETLFRSAGITKVVNRNGLLDSVLTINHGSRLVSRNLLYDGERGSVMLTSRQNEFEDPIYQYSASAGWFYSGLASAYRDEGLILEGLTVRQGRIIAGIPDDSIRYNYVYFSGGEEFIYSSKENVSPEICDGGIATFPTKGKLYAYIQNIERGSGSDIINLIDHSGKPFNGNNVTLKMVRSGRKNMNVTKETRVSLGNPLYKFYLSPYYGLWYNAGETRVVKATNVNYRAIWKVQDNFRSGRGRQTISVPYSVYSAGDTCAPYHYGNTAMSAVFTRDNCGDGYLPGTVTYTIPANQYSSSESVVQANEIAAAHLETLGKDYARQYGACKRIYFSVPVLQEFTRNNCPPGAEPGKVLYTLPRGADTSTISQADADAKAAARAAVNGQDYANTSASCKYYSAAFDSSLRKNNCPSGATGSLVHIQYPAGHFSSTSGQQAADDAARVQAQLDANAQGNCTYVNAAIDQNINKNDCPGGAAGSSVHVQIAAGQYSSTINQADADAQAMAAAQAYANANGKCPVSADVTWYCTDNNCDYQGAPYLRFDFPTATTTEIKLLLGAVFYYPNFPKYVYFGSDIFTPPAGADVFFQYQAATNHIPVEITIPAGVTTYTTSYPMYQQGYSDLNHSWFACQSCMGQLKQVHVKIISGSYYAAFEVTNPTVSWYNVP